MPPVWWGIVTTSPLTLWSHICWREISPASQ